MRLQMSDFPLTNIDGQMAGSHSEAINIIRRLLDSPELLRVLNSVPLAASTANPENRELNTLFRPNVCLLPAATQLNTTPPVSTPPMTTPPMTTPPVPTYHPRRFSNWGNSRSGKKPKSACKNNMTFFKDIILLTSPSDKKVPKHKARAHLHARGHIISALQLNKNRDCETLLNKLIEAYRDKIPFGARVEIVMSCGPSLVKPNLGHGLKLDGDMVNRIFRRGPLYLRPSVAIGGLTPAKKRNGWRRMTAMFFFELTTTAPPVTVIGATSTIAAAVATTSVAPPVPGTSATGATSDVTTVAKATTSAEPCSSWQNDYGAYIHLINDSDNEMDSDMVIALAASMEQQSPSNDVPIQDILQELSAKIVINQLSLFNINRASVLDGAFRGFRRSTYSPEKRISVRFSDDRGQMEEALDFGGPRREFLRLLMDAVSHSEMFEGQEGHLNLALNASAIREDKYFLAGRSIAVSLVHGGPPPQFLSKTHYDCIVKGSDNCTPVIEDLADMDLSSSLKLISESKTLEELRAHCEPLTDYMATAGCLRCLSTLMDKDKLVEDILRFQVILRVRGPLQRFCDGLETLGVLNKVRQHPRAFLSLLCYLPEPLTADKMDSLFQISWSEEGSNARVLESQVVAFWRDYLQDAEDEEGPTKLGDLLAFTTGSNVIPPMGLTPAPTIEFQMGKYPIANTCANCLRLPIHHRYEDFKMNMDFGIQNTQGFGMI